ncbi:hypothetical protein PFBG_06105 [Plasmodium falciparum 7G8]|uniref:Uncharacterized protein n=1 Tax=Plasmodium falciparum (isolate 7G8) TaxID=57266 RepID=W7EZ94_PLAF8|nr:hypothetical protein PFBG_06105 [Plasmodium falciparum 7G8]
MVVVMFHQVSSNEVIPRRLKTKHAKMITSHKQRVPQIMKNEVLTIWTNISTMCAPTFTTSNVHAILGTNFWVQRGPKYGYIKHRVNGVPQFYYFHDT